MDIKEKKKRIANAIKDFDYSIFGEWKQVIKGYGAMLRRAILLSSDEQFKAFMNKIMEMEKTIYDVIDGKQVNLGFKDEKEKEYFNQIITLINHISPERREALKGFVKKVIDVLRDEAPAKNN